MKIKSIWSSIVGGATSMFPILFASCKGGACVGLCVTPVASLFGISTATIAASPITNILEPLFIALSAISFTVSYYSLYKIPKLTLAPAGVCGPVNGCACGASGSESKKFNASKFIVWLSLVLSIGFIGYFEYNKYNSPASSGCGPAECPTGQTVGQGTNATAACAGDSESCADSVSSAACCEKEENACYDKVAPPTPDEQIISRK
jgi:hypothetical protein